MLNKTFRFDFRDLKLSVSQIESVIGYKEDEDRELVTGLIEEIFSESVDLCNIRAQYIVFHDVQFNAEKKIVNIGNIGFDIKRIVYSQLQKSDSIAIFLSTAGEEIGTRSSLSMKNGDMLRGYLYDIVGSEIAETAAALIHADLEKEALPEGLKITNRYSPGYCGWDVAEQHKIFQLLPGDFCRIRLTDSALMDPVKSVSGIIGIGRNVRFNHYTCDLCNQKDCVYRELRKRKNSAISS